MKRLLLISAAGLVLASCATGPSPKAEVEALGALTKPEVHAYIDPFYFRENLVRAQTVITNNNSVPESDVAGGVFIGRLLFVDLSLNVSLDFAPWIADANVFDFEKASIKGKGSYTGAGPGQWKNDSSWGSAKLTMTNGVSIEPHELGPIKTDLKPDGVANNMRGFSYTDDVLTRRDSFGIVNALFPRTTNYDLSTGPLRLGDTIFYVTDSKIVVHFFSGVSNVSQGYETSVGILEVFDNKAVWTPHGGKPVVYEKVGNSITKDGSPFITWN